MYSEYNCFTATSSHHRDSKDECKDDKPLDDRPWNKKGSKRKNDEESNEYTEISDSECTDVRSLSFHSEYTEHTVKNFTFIEESHERQLSFESNLIGSSPKSSDSTRKSMTLNSGESPTTSYESSSRAAEEIFISEDCHVVPRMDCSRDDSALEVASDPSKSPDKIDLKPRHASIDSVMDSALGDSCSSSDCQKRKDDLGNSDENKKFHKLDSHSWRATERDSLASRLPGKYVYH